MKQFWSLTWVELKNALSFSEMLYQIKNNPRKLSSYKPLGLLLLFLLLAVCVYFYYIAAREMAIALKSINQEGVLLNAMVTASMLLMFIFGMFYVFAALFSNKNIESLLSLPLPPSTIVASKIVQSTLFEYILLLFLGIPVLLGYGIVMQPGVLYWVYGILILLLLPVFPISLAAGLLIVILKFVNLKGRADKIQTVAITLLLLFIVAANFVLTKMGSSLDSTQQSMFFAQLLLDNAYLVDIANRGFPILSFATKAMMYASSPAGLGYFMLFLLFCALAFLVCILLGKFFYLDAVTKQGSLREKAFSREQFKRFSRVASSPVLAICKQDLKTMMRTPIYFSNCVLILILLPLLLFVPLVASGMETLEMLSAFYAQYRVMGDVCFALGIVFLVSMASITASSFSREGSAFWITQIVPVSAKSQFWARLLSSFLLGMIDVFCILILAILVCKVNFLSVLCIILMSLCILSAVLAIGLLIDAIHPVLRWENPVVAVKQNINVVLNMLIVCLVCVAFGFSGYVLSAWFRNILLCTFVLSALGVGLFLVMRYVFLRVFSKMICR